jgi:hypothetical protein
MKRRYYLQAVLLIVVLAASLPALAQTKVFEYDYDASGNRTQREFIQLKSATVPGGADLSEQQELLEDALEGHEIKIYPNPTKGKITVSISGLEKEPARVLVFSPQGRLIADKKFTGPENTVDLSAHPAGMYLMKIMVSELSADWKIVKD